MQDNIITYAEKYRNKTYQEMPFSDVDGLILCQMAYYDFSDVPKDEEIWKESTGEDIEKSTLEKKEKGIQGKTEEKKEEFTHAVSEYMTKDTEILLHALLTRNGDEELAEILKSGGRHGNLKIANFVDRIDSTCDKQFSAITYQLDEDKYFIAFRGTDNSVVGWKEDFNMTYQNTVPAQKEAVAYAIDMMERYEGQFYLGGHSKGGNLAVYTAMMLPQEMQNRLCCVYNYDGPGFWEEVYASEHYKKIRPIIKKLIPQTSIVGMLMEEDDNYLVVKNKVSGFMQHNAFNWIVTGNHFALQKEADQTSNILKGALNRWIKGLEREERKQFVTVVFDMIYSLEITTLNEVAQNRKENTRKLLKQLSKVEAEEKKLLFSVIGRLIQTSAREMRKNRKGLKSLRT